MKNTLVLALKIILRRGGGGVDVYFGRRVMTML